MGEIGKNARKSYYMNGNEEQKSEKKIWKKLNKKATSEDCLDFKTPSKKNRIKAFTSIAPKKKSVSSFLSPKPFSNYSGSRKSSLENFNLNSLPDFNSEIISTKKTSPYLFSSHLVLIKYGK